MPCMGHQMHGSGKQLQNDFSLCWETSCNVGCIMLGTEGQNVVCTNITATPVVTQVDRSWPQPSVAAPCALCVQ